MPDQTNVLVPEHPILPVLTQRRSPRAYTAQPVPTETLQQLFTAAASAASCYGEQPWRFIVGSKSTSPAAFEKILGTLAPFNQTWVQKAPVLAISIAKTNFSHDNNPNAWARHDVGQAVATLAVQAAALDLQVHQMAGFSAEAARTAFGIPEGYEPVAVFTIGDPGDLDAMSDDARARELAPRTRKPLAEFMFEGGWPGVEQEHYDQAPV